MHARMQSPDRNTRRSRAASGRRWTDRCRLRRRYPSAPPDGPQGLIFTNAVGGALRRTLVRSRVWRPGLPTRPSSMPRCCTALLAQLQLKLGEAGEDSGHHAARGARRIDTFAERPHHDSTLAKVADGGHDLRGVATPPVNPDDHDGVASACVVEERSKAGTLLPR
jgi:hypothetical protein